MTEKEDLNLKTNQVWQRTEVVLKIVLGADRTLQWLPVSHRQRLLILLIWEERYHIRLETLLTVLLMHYKKFQQREKKKKNMGLPINVKTLCSKTSEGILQDWIHKEYPHDEQVGLWKQGQQEHMFNSWLKDESLVTVPKFDVAKYPDPVVYAAKYAKALEELASRKMELRREWKLHTRPYRGNPFK